MGIPKQFLLLSSEDKELASSLDYIEMVTSPVEEQATPPSAKLAMGDVPHHVQLPEEQENFVSIRKGLEAVLMGPKKHQVIKSLKIDVSTQMDFMKNRTTALDTDEKRRRTEEQQVAKDKVIRQIKRKILEINQLCLSAREKKRRIEQMAKKQKSRHPDLFKTEKVKK